ncbi:MAG: hypothetical protein AB7F94_05525 [Nitrospira sp.]
MMNLNRNNAWNKRAAYAVTLGIVAMVGLAPGTTCADQQPPRMTIGFQSGTITAIYENVLQIDGLTFSLSPDAILQDDRGREIEASALVVSAEVKYRIKKERNDLIDRMMVILPR